jgi:hypothetical protein
MTARRAALTDREIQSTLGRSDLAEAREGLRLLADREVIGKVIVVPGP